MITRYTVFNKDSEEYDKLLKELHDDHNYLSVEEFLNLEPGEVFQLIRRETGRIGIYLCVFVSRSPEPHALGGVPYISAELTDSLDLKHTDPVLCSIPANSYGDSSIWYRRTSFKCIDVTPVLSRLYVQNARL